MTTALAPIATSTEQVHAMRQAYVEAKAKPSNRVMPELDAVIVACEERNLIDHKRAGGQLAAQANSALALADAYLASVEVASPKRERICYATGIALVQDVVFAMQEAVLDVMRPERKWLALIDDTRTLNRTSGEVA